MNHFDKTMSFPRKRESKTLDPRLKYSGMTNVRGQSLVEFAILLPLFLTIVFGIVEYSHMFMMSLKASNLSRAVANATFRDCAFLNDNSISSCLATNTQRVKDEATLILTNFNALGTVVTTTYAQDAASTPPVRLVNQQTAGQGGYSSNYNVQTLNAGLMEKHERIVIGEVIYPYEPITPLKTFLTLLNIRPVIYEVTVY